MNPILPMQPQAHDDRPVPVHAHVIPDDDRDETTSGAMVPPRLKRPRPTAEQLESYHIRSALDSLKSLGDMTHALTSSLIKKESSDLNRTLLAIQQRDNNSKRQRRGDDDLHGEGELLIETPKSSDSSTPLENLNSRSDDDEDQAEECNVNDLWRRVNRNKRMAVMLRDFEVLQKLLTCEIAEMANERQDL